MKTIQEIFKFCAWMLLGNNNLAENVRKAFISIINCRCICQLKTDPYNN